MGERVTVYEIDRRRLGLGPAARPTAMSAGCRPMRSDPPAPRRRTRSAVLRTLAFPGPDIKLPPMSALPFGARVSIARDDERFAVDAIGWHYPARASRAARRNASRISSRSPSASSARPICGAARPSLGIDCSGLVQVALQACGRRLPARQRHAGKRARQADVALAELKRGDLIFWKGHVAIVRDAQDIIHANAHHMAVAIEPAERDRAHQGRPAADVTCDPADLAAATTLPQLAHRRDHLLQGSCRPGWPTIDDVA